MSRTVFRGLAGTIAGIIGEAACARLLSARGGTELVIPASPAGTLLAELIGETDAGRLIAALGPGKISLPAGPARGAGARRRRALARLAAGESLLEVALGEDLSVRTVSRLRASAAEAPSRQFELPFDLE